MFLSVKNILLLLLVIPCSCAKVLHKNEIVKVTFHGTSLYGFKKFEMDTTSIKMYDDDCVARVNPKFIYELNNILRKTRAVSYDSFSKAWTRVYYRAEYNNGKQEYIFMNFGASEILYKNTAFHIDSAVAIIIMKYLPKKSNFKKGYDRASYTPSILIKRHNHR